MTAHGETPVVAVVGWKNSGKTTLVERLIAELTRRGLRIASVKHAHHAFQIDDGATDSARHRRAGAAQVAIVSSERVALVTELRGAAAPDLAAVLASLAPCDLVVVEGYKTAAIPKIEVRRRQARQHTSLADSDPDVIAIASDHPVEAGTLPVFGLDEIAAIADHILARSGAI